MSVPDVKKRLKAIQERGGKYVVVDPRKSETADHADEHLFIKPGTDAYLLLAILHVLFEKQLTKPNDLIRKEDLQTIETVTKEYSPKRVSQITGVSKA